jgi:hypothetical protein
MLEAVHDYVQLLAKPTQCTLAAQADKWIQIGHGFNYAFDSAWLLPVGKWIYTRLVRMCFDADRRELRLRHSPATKVKV